METERSNSFSGSSEMITEITGYTPDEAIEAEYMGLASTEMLGFRLLYPFVISELSFSQKFHTNIHFI